MFVGTINMYTLGLIFSLIISYILSFLDTNSRLYIYRVALLMSIPGTIFEYTSTTLISEVI